MWSYKTLLHFADEDLEQKMNALGIEGWKLLHAFPTTEAAGGLLIFCIFGKYHDPDGD